MAAVDAAFDVSAQRRGPARRQGPQRPTLVRRQRAAVAFQESIPISSNHLRHFQRRPCTTDAARHGRPSADRAAALPLLLKGLNAFRATGAGVRVPYYLGMLGDAYTQLGRFEDALLAFNEAL
jgi:hypothetical protein